jgi:hypothetical protein
LYASQLPVEFLSKATHVSLASQAYALSWIEPKLVMLVIHVLLLIGTLQVTVMHTIWIQQLTMLEVDQVVGNATPRSQSQTTAILPMYHRQLLY